MSALSFLDGLATLASDCSSGCQLIPELRWGDIRLRAMDIEYFR